MLMPVKRCFDVNRRDRFGWQCYVCHLLDKGHLKGILHECALLRNREGFLLEVPVATMKTVVSQEFLLTYLFSQLLVKANVCGQNFI